MALRALLLLAASPLALGQNDPLSSTPLQGIHLQTDGLPSVDSYVRWKGDMPAVSSITICFHLYVYHTLDPSTPVLSYAVEDFPDEILLMIGWDEGVELVCCGGRGRLVADGVVVNSVRKWTHFCIAMNLEQLLFTIFVDSIFYYGNIWSLSGQKLSISGGGNLLLGQEQDLFGGGFNREQSYEGYVADLHVFPEALTEERMREFGRCGHKTFGQEAIVSFDTLEKDWDFNGMSAMVNFTEEDLCSEGKDTYVMFPEVRSYNESRQMCNMLKGRMAAPANEEENRAVVEVTLLHIEACTFSWSVYAYLDFQVLVSNDSWTYVDKETNETLTYTNFRSGYSFPMSDYRCVFLDSRQIGKWTVYPCNHDVCTVCSFSKPTFLRLRGLCGATLIDRHFSIGSKWNMKPSFEGIGHSDISWNNETWVLTDRMYPGVTAIMEMTGREQYPFGLHKWNITGDKCLESSLDLLLTACRPDQYTCHDGTCIRKIQRCDLEVNCPDQSDERLCKAVVVPHDYITEVPPARTGDQAAQVALHVTLLSLQPLDTRNMKMTLDLTLTLKWRDPRLDMESLNYADTLNVIHEDELIWRPEVIFEDSTLTEADTTLHWQTFVAVMESGPLPDDVTRVREDEVYPGTKNSLKLTQTYRIQVSCQMDLGFYPFDSQSCRFRLRLQYFTRDLVAFNASGTTVEYTGTTSLREYELMTVSMAEADWRNHSAREIVLTMENLSGFYVSSTYVPTFLMVVISYSTLYFEIHDFNDRIMVSLTALLVLATLFTQITETTPKTAYLKLLDVWFVATILVNFFIVILLVTINVLRMRETQDVVVPFLGAKKVSYPAPQTSVKVNRYSQVGLPVVVFVLVVTYVILSLTD